MRNHACFSRIIERGVKYEPVNFRAYFRVIIVVSHARVLAPLLTSSMENADCS